MSAPSRVINPNRLPHGRPPSRSGSTRHLLYSVRSAGWLLPAISSGYQSPLYITQQRGVVIHVGKWRELIAIRGFTAEETAVFFIIVGMTEYGPSDLRLSNVRNTVVSLTYVLIGTGVSDINRGRVDVCTPSLKGEVIKICS